MDLFAPLQLVADWLVYDALGLAEGSRAAISLDFFVYDGLKILVLLIAINYLMAVINHYLPIERIRSFLVSRRWYGLDHLMASVFGAITPFCSCSSIPLFVGFTGVGIPLGVTLSFLITSPLVNEAAIAIFIGLFGLKVTIWYVVSGIVIGVLGGMLLGRFKLERYINHDMISLSQKVKTTRLEIATFHRSLLLEWWHEGIAITKKLVPYLLVGVGLGAAIHGFVPASQFESVLSSGTWWQVPLATIVAVPLYSNAVAVVPVMSSLVGAGVPLGTALAFMMATVGLSLPEALILKKIMRWQLLLAFFTTVATGIMLLGFLFNLIV